MVYQLSCCFTLDRIKIEKLWCNMNPCLEDEKCEIYKNDAGVSKGWQCAKGEEIKTTKVGSNVRFGRWCATRKK